MIERLSLPNLSPTSCCLTVSLVLAGCVDEPSTEALEPDQLRSLDDDLELHWTFENRTDTRVTDVSGNGRHGDFHGGVTFVGSPTGEAISLDGVDDYLRPGGASLRPPAMYGGVDGDFTISARVRVSDLHRFNTLCWGCGPLSHMTIGDPSHGGRTTAALLDTSTQGLLWPVSSNALVPDRWTEVTIVVDGGVGVRHYFDCELDSELSSADVGLDDFGYSYVGRGTSPGTWFAGEIDELRVWSRALSEQELAQLCPEPPPLERGLRLHWTFEDRYDEQILDVSGKGRHGTLDGGQFVSSPAGEALSLDGVDDWVSFLGPRSPDLHGGVDGDFTLSARVKLSDINRYNTLCYGCGPSSTLTLGHPSAGGKLTAGFHNQQTQSVLWSGSTPALVADQWTEVTMVVDGGVGVRHYFDCALDSELHSSALGLKDFNFSSVGLGSEADRWFAGEIDELRIWNRALPEHELLQLCPCKLPIHVDDDAPSGGDGRSWATAFNTLQAALDAVGECSHTQVWVAEGDYAPNPNSPVATLSMPVSIYGGFAGTETALEQREVSTHPTRLGADGWATRVVVIEPTAISELEPVRLDGFTIRNSSGGAIAITGALADHPPSSVVLANSSIEGNSLANELYKWGAGVRVSGNAGVEIANSYFADNQADRGGAVHFGDGNGSFQIVDSEFFGNTAVVGGAVYVDDDPLDPGYIELLIEGGRFEANSTIYFGGALYIEESITTIRGTVFIDNEARRGGALELADEDPNVGPPVLDIRDARIIGNRAFAGGGGGLSLRELGTTIVNTEIVENQAAGSGGGVLGRANIIHTTIAYNTAAGAGAGLWAPAGPDMFMRHVVVYPDLMKAVGDNIYVDRSCVMGNTWYKSSMSGGVSIAGPLPVFDIADLDGDGLDEYYLAPWPCVDFAGHDTLEYDSPEIDWTVMTTQISQCTDDLPSDPGVHYRPLFEAGVCE